MSKQNWTLETMSSMSVFYYKLPEKGESLNTASVAFPLFVWSGENKGGLQAQGLLEVSGLF